MASDQSVRIAGLLESHVAVICSSLGLPVA